MRILALVLFPGLALAEPEPGLIAKVPGDGALVAGDVAYPKDVCLAFRAEGTVTVRAQGAGLISASAGFYNCRRPSLEGFARLVARLGRVLPRGIGRVPELGRMGGRDNPPPSDPTSDPSQREMSRAPFAGALTNTSSSPSAPIAGYEYVPAQEVAAYEGGVGLTAHQAFGEPVTRRCPRRGQVRPTRTAAKRPTHPRRVGRTQSANVTCA